LNALQAVHVLDWFVSGAQPNSGFRCIAPIPAGARVDGSQWPPRGVGKVLARASASVGKVGVE
jgi:hypothetical protein